MKRTPYAVLASIITASTIATSFGSVAHAEEGVKTHTDAGEVSKINDSNDTSKPIDFKKAQRMSPKERANALTAHDKKLHNKEESEGTQAKKGVNMKFAQQYKHTNVNINKYIDSHNLKPAKIKEDPRIGNLPKYSYKSGKYVGFVVHETANPNSTLDGETNFMYNNYYNAFVHAFVDGKEIRQTAPADYLSWGSGPVGNSYFYQSELVEAHSVNEFAKSVNNQAYLAAYMLKRNGLKPKLAQDHNGDGTILSHNDISRYYGGTDHTDPIQYFASWNYDMHKFYDLVVKHYNKLNGKSTSTKGEDAKQSPIKGSTYTVKHGDTLYDVSKRSGVSISNIKKWSHLKSQVLYSGQKLTLKAPKSSKKSTKITSNTYNVQKGDTLYSISKRAGLTVDKLKKYNDLKSNNISVGQSLYMKPTYTVKKGQTLYRIATNHHMSVSQLKSLNGLKSNTIKVGQKLFVK